MIRMPVLLLSVVLLSLATAAFADYPCWRGEWGSGAGKDCGEPMVETLENARLVWRSEARTYQSYPENGIGAPYLYTGQGGPVMADGRVFFFYPMPDGRVYNKKAATAFEKRDFDPSKIGFDSKYELGKRYYGVTAEDVVLCCDAKTGKTLWQRNIPGGMNYGGRRGGWAGTKAGPLLTVSAAYGKVFVVGSTFRVFALDARTGKTVWENNLGPAYERIQKSLKSAIAAKDLWKLPVDWFLGGHPTTFADGVFCADDEQGSIYGGGLIGFDAETGRKLWTTPKETSSYPGPVRWKYKDKEYIISGRGALIEPKTGKILWGPQSGLLVTVAGEDMVIAKTTPGVKGRQGWECYRITPEKAELKWKCLNELANAGWNVPVVGHGHMVWVADKCFNSLDMATGKRFQKTEPGNPGSRTRCALVYGDGAVIQENSDIVLLAEDGSLTGGASCKGRIPGQPHMKYSNTCTGFIDDGFWYIRAANNIACLQLRKNLHARVQAVAGDVTKLLALCSDPDPAVSVDAVVALRRSGDKSSKVIEAMVACLKNPRLGAASEASRTLKQMTPPPQPLLAAAASEDRALRVGALRSLSTLEGLPVKVLAMATAESQFGQSAEAGKLLAARCRTDLAPMVDTIAAVSDDVTRGKLLALMRGNMNGRTVPGVLKAVRSKLKDVGPDGARGLLQVLSAVGNDEAWNLLTGIIGQKSNPKRDVAVDALKRWPNDRPRRVLETILADKGGESKTTRTFALGAALQSLEYAAAKLPARERAPLFAAKRAAAKELDMEPALLAALGRTKSQGALKMLGDYVNDEDVGEQAVEAMVICGKELEYGEMMPATVDLEILLRKVKDKDARETLTDLLEWIKRKHETTAPPAGADDLGGDDDDLGLDL